MITTIILAAGKGTRMHSEKPKVLHKLAGKPLLQHVIEAATPASDAMIVVYGHGGNTVPKAFSHLPIQWVQQTEQLGTGHAVSQTLAQLKPEGRTLILVGDTPLITQKTLETFIAMIAENTIGWLTAVVKNPAGLGRIIRNNNEPAAIVEEKDASEAEKCINEINTGICLIPNHYLLDWLPKIKNHNAQKEYYLTDLFSMAIEHQVKLTTMQIENPIETQGVNNKMELAHLERHYQTQQANKLAEAGLSIMDPARFDLRGTLDFGQDNVVDINILLEGDIKMGHRCYIGPNCYLKNVTLGDDVRIEANSILQDTTVDNHCQVGPFARLRPGTVLKAHAKVGNFVEMKKTTLGPHSKANHLSYIGDASIGENVNIGAGTITCNYDGANKHQSIIENGAFIGSNTSLIAPVTIGKNATIGAGSTVSKSVPANELTLTRSKQTSVSGWQRPAKKED